MFIIKNLLQQNNFKIGSGLEKRKFHSSCLLIELVINIQYFEYLDFQERLYDTEEI